MGDRQPIRLNTRALLDTANPITDREPGTLVTAQDVSSRYWGPRDGLVAFARYGEGPGSGFANGYYTFDGTGSYFTFISEDGGQADLGTKWTLDLWFRLADHTYAAASGQDYIGLFARSDLVPTLFGYLRVSLIGPADATNVGKVHVALLNTSARAVASATTFTLRGSIAVPEGSTQDKNTHVRVVRDGSQMTIFVNGVICSAEATSGTLVATESLLGPIDEPIQFFFGTTDASSTAVFKGRPFAACLREGAFDAYPIEASMPHNMRGKNVKCFIVNRRITDGSVPHVMDLSRFASHPIVQGTGWTYTGSNDNHFPVPAPVQGIGSWTSRRARKSAVAMIGGVLARKQVS